MKTYEELLKEYMGRRGVESENTRVDVEMAFSAGVMSALITYFDAKAMLKPDGYKAWEAFMDDATAASRSVASKLLQRAGKSESDLL